MIRRFLIPVVLLAVAIGAALQAQRTDNESDPGFAPDEGPPDFVVGTPMLSVRRTPEWLRQPLADNLLESEVRAADLTRVTPPATCIVVHRDGEVIASIQADDLLVPASNQKILTAAAILELAPATETFRTEVVHRLDVPPPAPADPDAEDQGRVFEGDLWLIGNGDPVLSTPDYVGRYDDPRTVTDFTALADAVAAELTALGVTEVSGSIIGDESKYLDEERDYVDEPFVTDELDDNGDPIEVPIWKESFRDENQAGPLSALLLNDGYTQWNEDPHPSLRPENVRADNPAVAAADTLRTLLGERGIVVQGASSNDVAPLLSERISLATVESPPLSDIVARMLTHSDNTTAEMLLKEIGVRSGVTSTRGFAVLGMRNTLRDAGYPMAGVVVVDGSGLSSLNRITCSLVIDILDRAGPDSPLVQGMAVVGETGTVRGCFENRSDVSDISAKTGTLNDVTALSGVTVADNGDVITFAMLANGEGVGITLGTCDLNEVENEIQVVLIDAVAGHPYGPALSDLGPLRAVGG